MPKKKKEPSKKPKRTVKPKKWGVSAKEKEEHAERDIYLENEFLNTIKAEVPKMKLITLSVVSQKYNVRISLVKQILRELLEAKKIKPFIQSNRLKVFVPA